MAHPPARPGDDRAEATRQHVRVNFYLNNAVYLLEDLLEAAVDKPAEAGVNDGDRHEHCWTSDHSVITAVFRLRCHQRFIPRAVEHFLATASDGADVTSWRC